MAWGLNVDGYFAALQQYLEGTSGYAIELRRNGAAVRQAVAGSAIDGPVETVPGAAWQTTTNMQVGSCSKLITAIALTKLLADTGISADEPIGPYLPGYWAPGPNVGLLTFDNLMAHTSGLSAPGDELIYQTYGAAKQAIEQGIADAGQVGAPGQRTELVWDYQNVNFALCRILLATVSGTVKPGYTYRAPGWPGPGPILVPPGGHLTQAQADDEAWDDLTLQFYLQYVQQNVFGPAGVIASMSRPDQCALAYTMQPVTAPGWNSGDMTEYAGPAGWHLSVDGMLDLMGAFRRGGTIMSPAAAQAMLDAGYGIDWGDGITQGGAAGTLYPKNGLDGNGTQAEQTTVVFLPLDMEVAVFVNSPSSGNNLLLNTCDLFVANLADRPVIAAGSSGTA